MMLFSISRFLTLSDLTISPEIFLIADWGWDCSLVRDCALGLAEFSLVSQWFSLLEFSLQVIGPLQPGKRECEMRDSCALMSASSLRARRQVKATECWWAQAASDGVSGGPGNGTSVTLLINPLVAWFPGPEQSSPLLAVFLLGPKTLLLVGISIILICKKFWA